MNVMHVTEGIQCGFGPTEDGEDGVVVIAISLFPEVPGSIPESGKKRRFL